MTVLSVSSGLLLVFILDIRFLSDGLLERDPRSVKRDLNLVLLLQGVHDHIELLLSESVDESLSVRGIVLRADREILLHDLCKCLGYLVLISLVYSLVLSVCVRLRNGCLHIYDRSVLRGERLRSRHIVKLCERSDISGVKLGYLLRLVRADHVNLSDLLLCIGLIVVHEIIGLQHSGIDLYERVLSDKRIDDGLKYISGLRLCEIVIRLKDLIRLHIDSGNLLPVRSRKIFDDIREKRIHTARHGIRSHEHRDDRAFGHVHAQSLSDLILRELLPGEISVHELLARLGHGLEEGFPADSEIFL